MQLRERLLETTLSKINVEVENLCLVDSPLQVGTLSFWISFREDKSP